jgi:hypothetical protein
MGKIIPEYKNALIEKIFRIKFIKRYFEKEYLKNFFASSNTSCSGHSRVLLYSGISSAYNRHIEILLYHLLKKKGFEVDYFICNGSLPACEILTKHVIETQGKEKFCRKCVRTGTNSLKASHVDFSFIQEDYGSFLKQQIEKLNLKEILSFTFEEINFGNIIEGALYRYYKSLNFGKDAEVIARNFLKASLINYLQVKKLYEKNNYRYLLFSHGIYSTWQPVVEYCKKRNINYICYDRAKRLGSANFNVNIPSPVWEISDAWERYKDRNLNLEEKEKVEKYLKERELQKNDVYSYNFSEKEKNLTSLKQKLSISENRKTITIFTNLVWDAANVSRDIAFQSPLDCIIKTIEKYRNNNQVHILIRTHPAEKVLGTKERYSELIRSKVENLPANVTIIEPEMNINSFSVLDISDIGVVHTSTVGLEMAIEGKPVILISETHFRDKGFTYDAQSEVHYFQLLDSLLEKASTLNNQVELAKKYFYLMMFEYQKDMPLTFYKGKFNGYSYPEFNSISENEEIVKIVDSLITGPPKDFVFWNKKT